jgi:glycosyltransferase involved in cell wall biosynthesis/uncharacterized SAM-binding protein YcdF (DUF218 family)
MIRVMHVISGLDQGGAEAMLVRLLRRLDREIFSQSVVSLTTRGVYGEAIERMGIPLLTLGVTGWGAMPTGLDALRRATKQQRPDIVQTWLYHADLMGLVAARMANDAAVVWNVRCGALLPGDVPASTRLLTRVLARLSSSADVVLFNSNAGLEAHRAIGYRPSRSEVIPNGFDLEERRPDNGRRESFRAELAVSEDTFVVGMISRAHRMKDQSTFLAAAARLRQTGRQVRFVIAGLNQTWQNTTLAASIDHFGLRDRVHLLGVRHDVPRIMTGLDCLVSTSTSEGFPNVLGEAMACGVPCVATDAGDSRLIVGHTGIIVPIGDVDGIVAGMSRLMTEEPEQRCRRARASRERIVENFELGQIAARYGDLYRQLSASRHHEAERTQEIVPATVDGAAAAVGSGVRHGRYKTSTAPSVLTLRQRTPAYPYSNRQRLALGTLCVLVLLYVLLFHTPLVWAAGNLLTVRQDPVHSDAIVVFSGNGESAYVNTSYQRRAIDAARYYKAGWAPLLVISSGFEQTISEVDIIRALLLAEGVPPSAIYILAKYPSSTWQNVRMVDDVLATRGLRSILFVTAPYHSRRATLIWRKVAPGVTVRTVPVVDTPPAVPQWHADLDEIRAIGYEYLAIAYDRARGWL